LIVHVASIEMARAIVSRWPQEADDLADRFWPGPLTLVLPKASQIPDGVTAGLPTVGVRIPAHPIARELIEAAGVPVAAPSANRFTQLSPTTAAHVRAALGDRIDMVLDGGPTDVGIESTVLSLVVEGRPVLLRPGMVSRTAIEAVIGEVEVVTSAEGAHPSPGMHDRHYSPGTPLLVTNRLPEGRGAYLWQSSPQRATIEIQMPSNPKDYARRLYRTLHDLDAEQLDFIAVEPPLGAAEWDGIRDRLRRAESKEFRAGDRVI
jgi:L-threonylcarbamoyladenylate synthase